MKHGSGPTAEHILSACSDAGLGAARGGVFGPGLELDRQGAEKLAEYIGLLVKWNRVMNLVGHARWQDIFTDLIADSLRLARFLAELDLAPQPLSLDLGAGAGLPGIPLRVLWQSGTYRLVETRAKRTTFMRTALAKLRLPGVEVYEGRAEDALEIVKAESGGADLVVSRAFMPWQEVLGLVRGYVRPAGRVVFMTNAPAPQALPDGWEIGSVADYEAGGGAVRGKRYFWSFAPV